MKKGLLVGVAVGGVLYVMWRRRQPAAAPPEPAWQPPPPPPPPPAADTSAADEEVTEELAEPSSDAPAAKAPAAEQATAGEPASIPVAAPKRDEPTLHHPGRRVPLTSSGFASRPRAAAFRTSDRPQAAQARISWPGMGGPASQKPKPLRLVPTRARPAALRRSR